MMNQNEDEKIQGYLANGDNPHPLAPKKKLNEAP